MGRVKVNKRRQQARQNTQVALGVTVHQVGGRITFQYGQQDRQCVQAGTDGYGCIGRCGGGKKRPTAVAHRVEPFMGPRQVVCGVSGGAGHFAITKPVGGLRRRLKGPGQCQQPRPYRCGTPLCHKGTAVRNDQRQRIVPRAGIDQLRDGGIGLSVGCQNFCGLYAKALQTRAVQHLARPCAQKFAKKRMKGISGRPAGAAIGEQAAPGQIGQEWSRIHVARYGNGHFVTGAGQKRDVHQGGCVGFAHFLHHLACKKSEQAVPGGAGVNRRAGIKVATRGQHQDHGRCPTVAGLAQGFSLPVAAMQCQQLLCFAAVEAERRGFNQRQLLA